MNNIFKPATRDDINDRRRRVRKIAEDMLAPIAEKYNFISMPVASPFCDSKFYIFFMSCKDKKRYKKKTTFYIQVDFVSLYTQLSESRISTLNIFFKSLNTCVDILIKNNDQCEWITYTYKKTPNLKLIHTKTKKILFRFPTLLTTLEAKADLRHIRVLLCSTNTLLIPTYEYPKFTKSKVKARKRKLKATWTVDIASNVVDCSEATNVIADEIRDQIDREIMQDIMYDAMRDRRDGV